MLDDDLWPVLPLFGRRLETSTGDLQRGRVPIEPNQTTLSAEASCDDIRVSAQAQGGIDTGAATPDGQEIDRFF